MGIYEELGVRRLINASGTNTVVGGSLMSEPVLAAMADAARSYVTLRDLQDRAGERIADLVGVDAALVSSGAAGGIALAAAACIAGADWDRIYRLPDTTGLRNEIVVAASERPNYMYQAAEHVGARLVQVGTVDEVTSEDFAAAVGSKTAAVLLIVASLDRQRMASPGVTATVTGVAKVARAAGVPLIVDAAAELPPVASIRAFLDMGADVAIFSGGKAIRGPQGTGLVLGRRDLVAAAAMNNNPYSAIGRPMKVGKEEIAGLVRAVELYVARDEAAELRDWELAATFVTAVLAGVPGVRAEVVRSGLYSRPPGVPVCAVHLDEATIGVSRDECLRRLRESDPMIVAGQHAGGVFVNPMTLGPGEERVVAEKLLEVVATR
jgi:L-seryl-tRNA(Ser) seleniumtransferase